MAAIPDKYSGRASVTVQTATGGTTIRPIVSIPEKYTRTFSGQPVSAPPSVVISGVRKPEEGPVTGRTITIVGSGIVPPQSGGGRLQPIRVPAGRTIVGEAAPVSSVKPSAVVISGVRKPEEGPVKGKTLEEQGMRVVGGKVFAASDLQFGSWSDPMKEIARSRAEQGDVLSKLYLAVDDPTIPGSPAWMEAGYKKELKQYGFAEGKYGSPGGPTTGNVVGDVVLQGLKGLHSGITGIVPGTVRTVTSGVWGLSLMKNLTPEEVLETTKGGAQTMVSEVVKGAAEDPAFFVGSLIPSVVLAKGFKTTKVSTTKKTPSVKIITEGKGGTKTTSAPKGSGKVGTTRVVSSVDVPETAGQITRNAETYMAKLPSKEQWVIVNRMLSGENITLPIAKKIVREYRVFGERTRKVDVIPATKIEEVPISIGKRGGVKLAEGRIGITQEALEFTKGLKKYEADAIRRMWEAGEDITIKRAKEIVKEIQGTAARDMAEEFWGQRARGTLPRLEAGQFKKVTPGSVLTNPDDVLRSVSKISIVYKTKNIVSKTVPKVSKTKKPVEVKTLKRETSVSVRRPADVVKASKARRAEKAVSLSKQRPAARGGEGERILKERGRGGELPQRADVPKVQADVKVPQPAEGMVMMRKMRTMEVLKTADDVKTIPKQKMATATKLRPADRVKASKAKTKTSSKDAVKTRASKRVVVPIRADGKRRLSLTPLAAVGAIVTIKSGQGVVSQIVPDTTMPPVSIPRISVQEMTAELSTEAVVPDTRVLTGVAEDAVQIQKPVSVVKTVKPAKLVEKPKIPVVPRVRKKPKRPVKTDASKDKKEEEKKKRVKRVVRTYVQRDYLLPWMIDESDDSWLQTDLRRMRAV